MDERPEKKKLIGTGVKILIAVMFLPACFILYLALNEHRSNSMKTGITRNGDLMIVYPYSAGGYYFDFRITDEGVIRMKEKTSTGKANGKQGAVFTPVSAGEADIYLKWLENPGTNDYQSEVFHVTVDGDMKISCTNERISLEQYSGSTGK